jgi:hypothetical protein
VPGRGNRRSTGGRVRSWILGPESKRALNSPELAREDPDHRQSRRRARSLNGSDRFKRATDSRRCHSGCHSPRQTVLAAAKYLSFAGVSLHHALSMPYRDRDRSSKLDPFSPDMRVSNIIFQDSWDPTVDSNFRWRYFCKDGAKLTSDLRWAIVAAIRGVSGVPRPPRRSDGRHRSSAVRWSARRAWR